MYKYIQEFLIDASVEKVFSTYFDYDSFQEWQPLLEKVVLVSGGWHEINHEIELHFNFNNQKMIMKESILKYESPYEAIVTYQMGTTFNKQIMHFKQQASKTLLIVETEFYFEGEPPASIEAFKQSTKKDFKSSFIPYVESI